MQRKEDRQKDGIITCGKTTCLFLSHVGRPAKIGFIVFLEFSERSEMSKELFFNVYFVLYDCQVRHWLSGFHATSSYVTMYYPLQWVKLLMTKPTILSRLQPSRREQDWTP